MPSHNTKYSVVIRETDSLAEKLLSGTKQQQQAGKIVGFGNKNKNRLGAGISDDQHEPIKLDSFGTVMFPHAGNETILIN